MPEITSLNFKTLFNDCLNQFNFYALFSKYRILAKFRAYII